MICSQQVKNLQWIVQGHSFISTAGVLPLKCFDMILGDWLESCSPMWIHWSNKIMKFTYQGKRIELHGVKQHTQCTAISYPVYRIGSVGRLSNTAFSSNGSCLGSRKP